MAITVALGGMCLQVGGDLGLQRREEHPSCPLAGDLVEHGAATDLVILRLPPRPATVSMDAASLPPRMPGRRSLRREDTPPGSRAPRSRTSGHTSAVRAGVVDGVEAPLQVEEGDLLPSNFDALRRARGEVGSVRDLGELRHMDLLATRRDSSTVADALV